MITEQEQQFCIHLCDISLGPMEAKHNTLELCKKIFADKIPGDLVEAGVFAGCHPILMSMLAHVNGEQRRVHMIDSFEGIPNVQSFEHETDIKAYGLRQPGEAIKSSGVSVCDLPGVKGYVVQFGGDPNLIDYHKGWFQDTLPEINTKIKQIALLRLDVDLVESLELCLAHLYPLLSTGGWFICDDYMSPTCKDVIDRFMRTNEIAESEVIGPEKSIIFWQKK